MYYCYLHNIYIFIIKHIANFQNTPWAIVAHMVGTHSQDTWHKLPTLWNEPQTLGMGQVKFLFEIVKINISISHIGKYALYTFLLLR